MPTSCTGLPSLLLAAFVINLDITIVNVALPSLVRELHASNSQLQWVVDGYNSCSRRCCWPPAVSATVSAARVFLVAGLVVFGAASVAGGLTTSAGPLIAARCFMGVGAAMIFPATLSLISNVFTDRIERAKAIGLWVRQQGWRSRSARSWRLAARRVQLVEHLLAMAPVAALGALWPLERADLT